MHEGFISCFLCSFNTTFVIPNCISIRFLKYLISSFLNRGFINFYKVSTPISTSNFYTNF